MGGQLGQLIAVDAEYVEKHGIYQIMNDSQAAFLKETTKPNIKLDEAFIEASKILPLRYYGGQYQIGKSGIAFWVNSITQWRKNLRCLEWEAVPLTHFLSLDTRTKD